MKATTAFRFGHKVVTDFTVSIAPPSSDTSSTFDTNVSTHTASASVGTPETYLWEVVSDQYGTASIQGANNEASANLQLVVGNTGRTANGVYRCTITIGGVSRYAEITKTHFWDGGV